MIGIKKIEFEKRSDNVVYLNATFEVKSDFVLPSNVTISVPWQDNLSATEARVAQKLIELGEEITSGARKSFALPVPPTEDK